MEPSYYLSLGLALIGISFLLLVAELFIPSGGILFVLAVGGIAVGIALVFKYDTGWGLGTLLGVFVALPLFGGLLFYIWPRTPMGRRFFLTVPSEDATVGSLPAFHELEQLKGRARRTTDH